MEGIRINRFLADAGFGSRRQVETLVLEGRVLCNGTIVQELSYRVSPQDQISLDGQPVQREKKGGSGVWMYHKPRGLLCTRDDPEGRPTIWSQLKHLPPPYQAVGRLDMDSSGLLLVSRDGALSQLLMHPRHEVTKVYEVAALGVWKKGMKERLRAGVPMKEGGTGKAEVLSLRIRPKGVDLRLLLKRGKKREIRYSLEAIGLQVDRLHRVKLGCLPLGDLKLCQSRELSTDEVEKLKASIA